MRTIITTVALAATLAQAAPALAQIRVATTTEDLAALVKEVGGDKVAVEAFARGYQDPHFVEPKPSFILRLVNADLLVLVGRDLETSWLPTLLTQSRNAKIQPGAPGYLDASAGVKIVDIPQGQVTRAMGDVHPQGNPHYWLDPDNGRVIARSIHARLAALRPADKAYFDQRLADFDKRLADATARWNAAMAPLKGTKIVTYHRSWTNFTERFGLNVVGYVEPKPGIPPSASHIVALINEMKTQGVKVILVEPYFDVKTPESIASRAGARVVILPPSVGGVKEATSYIGLFDHLVATLTKALR